MSQRLSQALHRFRGPLLALWLVALVAAAIAALPLADRLSGGGWYVPGSDSSKAVQSMRSGFADRGASNLTLVVTDERNVAGSPEFDRRMSQVMREVTADKRLETTGGYGWLTLSGHSRQEFVGKDRRTAVTMVGLALDDGTARRVLPDVQQEIDHRYAPQGLRVSMVSAGTFWGEINKLSAEGLQKAELITFPLVLLILLLLYRGVVAAVVSFVVSVTAIVLTFGVMSVLAAHIELSIFVQNAATMIGLGVSVDYSLFIISRYVDELTAGRDRTTALATALRTSGRTVLFSGLIVVLAMSSLFLVDLNVIRSIALGIVVVVAFATLASVVVLPVVLHLIGDRILWGRLPMQRRTSGEKGRSTGEHRRTAGERGYRWGSVARQIMRRPVLFLTLASAALLALAVPSMDLHTFTPDARIAPASSPVRQGFDTVREQFGPGTASPHQIVITSRTALSASPDAGRVTALQEQLLRLPHVTAVSSPLDVLRTVSPQRPLAGLNPAVFSRLPGDARGTVDHYVSADRRTIVLEVVGDDYASADRSRALLAAVRSAAAGTNAPGLHAVVGGETAEGADANTAIGDALPEVVAVMLAVLYLMLLVTFRSLLLPVKAIAINMLSLGATYGVLVLVFQRGLGAALFGFDQSDHLQNFVPILLLAILFSLSTDYEVFLLRRIREEHDAGADNTTAVATGMARTAPLISGAALLMVAVFGAFALTGIMPIQQLGLGLALAIALDATVIRLIVVPAAMRLMGRWNWWLPGRRPTRATASASASARAPEPSDASEPSGRA
ncbi:MMPL family transporter [Streptomyces sp. SID13666]|uniref:MMPL family transporter n=1 Tax=unclassified Streptomyces TaxID=2593676 RepID=UPI0013BF3F22|nr:MULTISPECIES: MMPL family transporter [unclassified Streptomyces]NEA52928.1 MMPL family transporter [Streptomyces sp. SID13666]NEA69745.1 MMPL family transporter [Streptomyces sp. SID13588]